MVNLQQKLQIEIIFLKIMTITTKKKLTEKLIFNIYEVFSLFNGFDIGILNWVLYKLMFNLKLLNPKKNLKNNAVL